MASFSAGTTFTDGVANDVTAAKLAALVNAATPTSGLIQDRTAETTIAADDTLLFGDFSDSSNLKRMTVANFAGTLPTATITTLNSTTGTITTLNSTTGTIATGVIPNLTSSTATFGTTTSTAATITSGTITNLASTTGTIATFNSTTGTIASLTSSTANITLGTIATLNSTNGTIATLNSTTGTIAGLNSTNGTIATLNSTTGTIAGLRSTTGTVTTLNSTTGTITNLSTTLAGDFTISQGTGTLGTTAVTAGSYGSVSAIPFITVDAKGRVTAATTGTFSTTPADGSITPAKLSQPFTRGTAVASTSGTAIDFTGIPSWVKRVTVMFSGVSANGSSNVIIQIGDSGGIESTDYIAYGGLIQDAATTGNDFTQGFGIVAGAASSTLSGFFEISNFSGNKWVLSGSARQQSNRILFSAGEKTLSALLDRVRITTANGTDTFDAGSVNIMYEG